MPNLLTMREFISTKIETPRSYLGDNLLIPEGMMVLYGDTGVYKSWFLTNMAFALASGQPFLGYPVPKPIRVLYLNCEISEGAFQDRIELMRARYPDAMLDDCFYRDFRDISLPTTRDYTKVDSWRLLAELIEESQATYAILDPMANVFTGNENNGDHVTAFTKGLSTIAKQLHCGIVLAHHQRKGFRDRDGSTVSAGSDELRGHTSLKGWADTIGHLKKVVTANGERVELVWDKTRHLETPPPETLIFNKKYGILEKSADNPMTVVQEVLASGPMRRSDVVETMKERVGWAERRTIDYMKDLVSSNKVERFKDKANKKFVMYRWVE